jgi:ABC-2 type transport system permease protein
MSDVALTLRQSGYVLLSMRRNPRVMVFTVAFPIVLLLLFASIFSKGTNATTHFAGGPISTDAYFTAGIMAYAISMACFSSLAIGLTTQREMGLLKRYRGTPVPAWTFIAARILGSIVMVAVMSVALLVIGWLAFKVKISAAGIAELALFIVLGTAAMCSLGVALTAYTTTADSASTIAPFSTVILAFISGVFIPTDQLPKSLVEIGKVFPLAHLAEGLQAAFNSGPVHLNGENVAVLALWGGVGLAIAARHFKWEPQGVGR